MDLREVSTMLLLSEAGAGAGTTGASQFAAAAEAPSHAERRRGLRVRQNRPVKIFEPLGSRYFGGQTEDVSSTGLRIELPAYAAVRPGETLSIHVGLSSRGATQANRRPMIPVRVVWVNREAAAASGKLEAGVEFMASIAARRDAA
jgi:hypothetical protein